MKTLNRKKMRSFIDLSWKRYVFMGEAYPSSDWIANRI